MKKLTILSFLLCILSMHVQSQILKIKYYSDKYFSKEVAENKAKFSEIITLNEDGSITKEKKDLSKNIIVFRNSYRDDEPVGIWLRESYISKKIDTLNYDFELKYKGDLCKDSISYIIKTDFLTDNPEVYYIAPKFINGLTLVDHLTNTIIYPRKAKDANIQGRVVVFFSITEGGKIENVYIDKKGNPDLDKEAARVIRQMRFATPPMLRGLPQKICVTMPIEFSLN